MSDLVELKPCPFCGGRFVAQGASREFISVWCGCGAQGPSVPFPETCIDPVTPIRKCYELWNRRSPDPELSRLSALVAELTKTGQIASRTPLDILGDQRIGVGVGQDGPYVTGPSSLSQLKDTTNADK